MRKVYGQKDPASPGLWSYPRAVRELGIDAIEHDNLHFASELPDAKDIQRMRKACDDEGLTSTLILCGAMEDIAVEDAVTRETALQKYKALAEAAAALGCHAIRVVCADRKTELSFDEKRKHAVEGIRSLAAFNATVGIDLLIENHGGYSSDPHWLAGVINEVNLPNCGVLADFTHWSVKRNPEVPIIDPYEGMKILAPLTRSVSTHAYHFDANGNETEWDYLKMIKILASAGFDGFVAIEYFGEDLTRMEGSAKAKALLENIRAELA
jgi:L-ribulose-5-phosphate 3-epimerase